MAVFEPDSTGAVAVKGQGAGGLGMPGLNAAAAEAMDVEGGRITIWAPLLLAAGIWAYFSLAREPGWTLAAALTLGYAIALWRFRAAPWVLALSLMAAGFVAADVRSAWVGTPLVRSYSPGIVVSGRVRDVDRQSARRMTLVLDIERADGLPSDEMPRSLRLQATGNLPTPRIGDRITGAALLLPLPLPVEPGAFDFGRSLFFQSIGGTGRFTSPPEIIEEAAPASYLLRRSLHAVRSLISARVSEAIPGPLGAFADAVITGERARIPRSMTASLQASGLFHILSISGLHMALVAGTAFWLLRALLALSPTLALTRPIRKWAAGAALAVAAFYMLLADGGAATQRSFIMIAVMFFAMLVDRPAISVRNLAVAAVIILSLSPEQATAASFQMSFMAVMGLAAFFEWWNARVPEISVRPSGRIYRWAWRFARLVAASLAASFIAGALSGIPAAHHFGRLSIYGVASNAVALPVVSIAVMPMALAAVILMPFGLEGLPLFVMEKGLWAVMLISNRVAAWPSAGLALPLLPASAAVALSLGATLLLVSRSHLRWLAVPSLLWACWGLLPQPQADVLIEERAQAIAVRDASGELVPAPGMKGSFAVRHWLAARGDDAKTLPLLQAAIWTCSASQCLTTVNGRSLAFLKTTAEITKPCPTADVIIAQYPLRRRCKGRLLTIDRFDVWRNGAHAIGLTGPVPVVQTARGEQGQRPWTWQPRPRNKSAGPGARS